MSTDQQNIISTDLIISLVFLLITFVLYNFGIKTWLWFYRSGLKYDLGAPIFGSNYRQLLNIETWNDTLKKIYYKYPQERFVLLQDIGGGPAYLIRDPELVKQITIKDFDCFTDRYDDVNKFTDPLIGYGLTNLKGDHWRKIRTLLTPLFTSQKFKQIFLPSLNEVKQELVQHIVERMQNKTYEVDMLELGTTSGIDAFALSALGIKTAAVKENGDKLYKTAKSFLDHLHGFSFLQYNAVVHFPKIMRYLFGQNLVKKSDYSFFGGLFKEVADYRKTNQIERSDYINLINGTEKDNKISHVEGEQIVKGFRDKSCTEAEAISQTFEFFEAAITENNVIINFVAHKLAENLEIQNRLYNEFYNIEQELSSESLNYESLQQMKYMDMILSEALRLCPITTELRRRATKKYILQNHDGTKVAVKPGNAVWIPAFILQNDPKYYHDPTVFDPERFNETNKLNNVAGTYAPFGMGPRECIGCRYTVFEVKVMFYYLLLKFQFEKVVDTNNSIDSSKIRLRLREN